MGVSDPTIARTTLAIVLGAGLVLLWEGRWVEGMFGLALLLVLREVLSKSASLAPAAVTTPPQAPPSILIVEDNALILDLVARDLEQLPARVFRARTLAEAHGVLNARQLDAAVVDLGLPDGSGLDLIRSIRHGAFARETAPTIPILILSGRVSLIPRSDVLRASGADAIIVKPFDTAEPQRWIRQALRTTTN